jgi:hypothetical protein
MPVPKFQNRDLPWLEVMAPPLLLDPALLKPMSPLPQLHLPAALLSPLPLKLCKKHFKFYQIPGMLGAVVRYTLFPLVCYPNKFYFGLLSYECRIIFWLSHRVCFPVSLTPQPWLLVYLIRLLTYESQGCFIKHTVLKL